MGSVSSFPGEFAIGIFDAVKTVAGDSAGEVIGRHDGLCIDALLDEIGDEGGIAKAVGMVAGAVFDHGGDAAAELLVDAFDHCRVFSQYGIDAAADVKEGNILARQEAEFRQDFRIRAGGVGVDAGDVLGVSGRPRVGIFAAAAHADEGGFFGEAVFVGEIRKPGIPFFAGLERGVGRDVGDVESATEQLDFGLRLVIPVAALP